MPRILPALIGVETPDAGARRAKHPMALGLRLHRTAKRAATAAVTLDLPALDKLLDVPLSKWDPRVAKVVRDFRSRAVQIEVPDSPILASFTSTQVTWVGLFEAQIRNLPRMDRAAEFRIARAYDFMKARVRDALRHAGHAPAKIEDLVLRPVHALPPPARKATVESTQHLDRCVTELERLRNLYVEGALYLVFGPVRRYRDLGVDENDLLQEGAASLFQAIEGFDWRREVRFKTYAVYWVQQAVLKTLYNASRTVRIPIWVQKTFRKIKRVQERRLSEDGAVPHPSRVAQELGITEARVHEILAVRRFAVSLDAAPFSDAEGATLGQSLADDSLTAVPDTVREGDMNVELRAVLEDLPERERMILQRRFGLGGGEPETLSEIAKDLGVTAERVRQLQKAAIERLQGPEALSRLKSFA